MSIVLIVELYIKEKNALHNYVSVSGLISECILISNNVLEIQEDKLDWSFFEYLLLIFHD